MAFEVRHYCANSKHDDIEFVTEFPCFLDILFVLNQAKPKYERYLIWIRNTYQYFFQDRGIFRGGGQRLLGVALEMFHAKCAPPYTKALVRP